MPGGGGSAGTGHRRASDCGSSDYPRPGRGMMDVGAGPEKLDFDGSGRMYLFPPPGEFALLSVRVPGVCVTSIRVGVPGR